MISTTEINEYFRKQMENKSVGSSSGLLDSLGVKQEEIKNNGSLYNCLLSNILSQSIRIPKHAHESIMEDFTQRFGSNSEENIISIREIKNTEISLEDFRKKCDISEQ